VEQGKQGISLDRVGSFRTESLAAGEGSRETAGPNFDELLWEARISDKWGEYRRALDFYQRALVEAPERVSSKELADIVEAMGRLRGALAECAHRVGRLQSDVAASRHDPEKQFALGTALTFLGRAEEAIQHLRAALPFAESMLPCCRADLFCVTGWYHFRREEYQEALRWFERAAIVKPEDPFHGPAVHRAALLSLLLVYAELGMKAEAQKLAQEYTANIGRVPWPEARALRKLNINADAIYIEHVNGFV